MLILKEKRIKAMSHFSNRISVVERGQGSERIILLPTVQIQNQVKGGERGEPGFGSSDAS